MSTRCRAYRKKKWEVGTISGKAAAQLLTSFQPAVRAALRTSAGQQFAGGDTSYSTELAKKLSSRWSAFLTQRKEKNAAFASREEGRRGEGGRGKVWAEAERVDGRQVVELNSGTPACETLPSELFEEAGRHCISHGL